MEGLRTAAVWARSGQSSLARAVAHLAGLTIRRAGGPDKPIHSELGAERLADLRQAIVEGPEDVVLLLAPARVDARSLRHIRGRQIVATEPLPASALTLQQEGWLELGAEFRLAGGMRFWRGFHEAAVPMSEIGRPPMVVVKSCSSESESTLGARLFDAADAVVSLMGEPASAFAAWSPAEAGDMPTPGAGGIPESLATLMGSMSVTLSFVDGRAASIVASDRASWDRSVEVISSKGGVKLTDRSMVWFDRAGAVRDRWEEPSPAGAWPAADALARGVQAVGDPSAPPSSLALVLAVCQAALLSLRTGQAESIETLRRLADT